MIKLLVLLLAFVSTAHHVSGACTPIGTNPLLGQTVSGTEVGYTWTATFGVGGRFTAIPVYDASILYVLGNYDRLDGNVAYYINGDFCAPISGPRYGTVRFQEDCNVGSLQFVSAVDLGYCSYDMLVTGVCYCTESPTVSPIESASPTESPTVSPAAAKSGKNAKSVKA